VLKPGGQLFIYTRTPQQNARTISTTATPTGAMRQINQPGADRTDRSQTGNDPNNGGDVRLDNPSIANTLSDAVLRCHHRPRVPGSATRDG
jgi:hypothetical protein